MIEDVCTCNKLVNNVSFINVMLFIPRIVTNHSVLHKTHQYTAQDRDVVLLDRKFR
jgi:hypothetical protein